MNKSQGEETQSHSKLIQKGEKGNKNKEISNSSKNCKSESGLQEQNSKKSLKDFNEIQDGDCTTHEINQKFKKQNGVFRHKSNDTNKNTKNTAVIDLLIAPGCKDNLQLNNINEIGNAKCNDTFDKHVSDFPATNDNTVALTIYGQNTNDTLHSDETKRTYDITDTIAIDFNNNKNSILHTNIL